MTPFISETDLARSRPFCYGPGCVMPTTVIYAVRVDAKFHCTELCQLAVYDKWHGLYFLTNDQHGNATRVA